MVIAADENEPPPSGREQLAAELRRLRDLAGVSGRQLAQLIGISQSKVSRIESGTAVPSLPEVRLWGEALDVSIETQERLTSLTEAAFTEVHPYRVALQRRGHLQDLTQEEEAPAWRIRTFQASVVPGLLQLPDYVRHVLALTEVDYTEEYIADAIGGRLLRQIALYEPDRSFDFLITEAALRWRPGPVSLQLAQLDRLSVVGSLENVSIGLIPWNRQATAPTTHSFVIHDRKEDGQESSVSIDAVHAAITVNGESNVAMYESRWAKLARMAVFGDEAREFLAELSAEFRRLRD